jgi:FkbM family methyltransferase
MTPRRLNIARAVCQVCPPILAQRLGALIYPRSFAYRDDFAFTRPARTGSLFCGRTSDFHGYSFSIHGFYEWRNWAIAMAICSPGDTILEIGANVGTETVGYRDIVGPQGRVFAFEPLPTNIDALRYLVSLNRWANIEILPFALADRNGTVSFALPPDRHASGVGRIVREHARDLGLTTSVKCAPLDSLSDKVGKARAIFCDTEGAEVMVLKGATSYIRRHQPAIVLEASPKLLAKAGSSLGELLELIRDYEYTAFEIGRFGVLPIAQATARKAGNWLCLPNSEVALAERCANMILRCLIMPCMRGLNPLCRRV